MIRRVYFGVIEVAAAGYAIYFPDLPGCVSAADTLEELSVMASEALQLHVDGTVEDGDLLPEPSTPDLDAERAETPEADLRGLLAVEVRVPDLPDHITVDLKSELVREIAERSRVTAEQVNTRQFVESAVRRELERLKKSA